MAVTAVAFPNDYGRWGLADTPDQVVETPGAAPADACGVAPSTAPRASLSGIRRCEVCGGDNRGKPLHHYRCRWHLCTRCRNSVVNRRVGAYLVDLACLYAGSFVLGAFMGVAFGIAAGPAAPDAAAGAVGLIGCFGTLLSVIYFLMKDALFAGRSPGKALLGIRVIDADSGQPIKAAASAKRNLPLLMPFMPLIAAIQIGLGDSHRLGERWANTVVVRTSWPVSSAATRHQDMSPRLQIVQQA